MPKLPVAQIHAIGGRARKSYRHEVFDLWGAIRGDALRKLSDILFQWWDRVKGMFDFGVGDFGGHLPESDSIKCPACRHDSVPFASSSLGPVMKCTYCAMTFTVRKF